MWRRLVDECRGLSVSPELFELLFWRSWWGILLVQHTAGASQWCYGEFTVVRDPSVGTGAPQTPAGAVKLLGFREKVWLNVLAALSGLEEVCKMLKRNMLRTCYAVCWTCSCMFTGFGVGSFDWDGSLLYCNLLLARQWSMWTGTYSGHEKWRVLWTVLFKTITKSRTLRSRILKMMSVASDNL